MQASLIEATLCLNTLLPHLTAGTRAFWQADVSKTPTQPRSRCASQSSRNSLSAHDILAHAKAGKKPGMARPVTPVELREKKTYSLLRARNWLVVHAKKPLGMATW